MSSFMITIIGIVLFAIATAILYALGIKKSIKQDDVLKEMLYNNGAREVVAYLKKHDTIKKSQIKKLIWDVRASEFHSKKRAIVTDSNDFTDALVSFMVDKKLIVKDKAGYRLL